MKGSEVSKILLGLFLILLGIAFLFDQFTQFDFFSIFRFFIPISITILGIYFILGLKRIIFGLLLSFIGIVLIFSLIFNFTIQIWNLWPLILVIVGFNIIFNKGKKEINNINDSTFDSVSIFWGEERSIRNQKFKKGSVLVLFGSSEIDLRESTLSDNSIIEIVCIFGAVTLMINKDMKILNEGIGIFGALEDKSSPNSDAKLLKIKGLSIFGGVEIKN